jgi:nicotinamidase/pyrazinamidase
VHSHRSRSALIVVDVQNDFADPAGSLFVRGAPAILPLVTAEIDLATRSGALVVYTQDWHPAHTPHFAADGGVWPVHCVGGTWGAELHQALLATGPRVRKGTNGEDGYSGFTVRDVAVGTTTQTELASILREAGIEDVAVCGLATDYCVKATAIDSAALGFRTTLLRDAVAAVEVVPGDGDRAIEAMAAAGVSVATAARA